MATDSKMKKRKNSCTTKITEKGRGGFRHKNAVLTPVARDGKVKSIRVKNFNDIQKVIKNNIDLNARFMTDAHKKFRKIGKQFASHETVNRFEKEYARGDVNTNTVEVVFSIFKRGMEASASICDASHLHRYPTEFDFRCNNRVALKINDVQRADNILSNVSGKRLTHQTTAGLGNAGAPGSRATTEGNRFEPSRPSSCEGLCRIKLA